MGFRKRENIGLPGHKHRNFCLKSSEVLPKEVRCFAFSNGETREKSRKTGRNFSKPTATPCLAQTLQERYGRENSLNFHDSKTLAMLSSFGLDVFPPKSKSHFKLIYRTYHNHSILNLIIAYTQKIPVSFGWCCHGNGFLGLSPWRGWCLLKEGGERLSVGTLRACSYKAKAEGWHQGLCPPSYSRGFYGFCIYPWIFHKG